MAVGEICVVEEDESESRKKRCAGAEIEAAVAAARPVTALNSPDVGAVLRRRLFLSARRPDGLRGSSFGHLTCCCWWTWTPPQLLSSCRCRRQKLLELDQTTSYLNQCLEQGEEHGVACCLLNEGDRDQERKRRRLGSSRL